MEKARKIETGQVVYKTSHDRRREYKSVGIFARENKSSQEATESDGRHVSSVAQSYPTLCHPMNHSTPGVPVHH